MKRLKTLNKSTIGIDIGSFKTTMAQLQMDNEVVILKGPSDDKHPPSIIFYPRPEQNEERKIGNEAKMQMSFNLKMTFPYFNRLLGLTNVDTHQE